ncbi:MULTISPECIES: FAD-dependent oxidoreductase [unclassified Streptomyces]|uniref:FAD-dependent oxidoreductase n=1 Tax=unclassified Streptomyces TaxID=2593676 RepID=UPI0022B74414|nr:MULTISPECIES: FAD-dependent oxidoreductase [unclassified Streptomyces]MCZ7413924.1 FAD-dependent oxidoreductase [Streptomyces sp. WMMC897]MCZ7430920.1 FAD-dependent oxidoreductase [Streptomyces sp. WMMC1477]
MSGGAAHGGTDGAVVVVGNGPAGHRLAERLARLGHRGPVTVLGAEPRPAYHRPLLSLVLAGRLPAEALEPPPAPGREDGGATVRTGVRAVSLDRRRRTVRTEDGEGFRYDTLVLATGARPRLPELPGLRGPDGMPAPGVAVLRTPRDCAEIAAGAAAGPVCLLGGGVLGVEAAVALRGRGHDVTLVHQGPHPLHERLDARAGELLVGHLEGLGVRLLTSRRAVRRLPAGLLLADGEEVPAGTLVVCAGVLPETALARRAGLAVRSGVLVDDRLCTTDPRVRAIGDCAEHGVGVPGSVHTAWAQADALAALLTGRAERYRGDRPALRPRVGGLELAVFGPPEDARGERDVERVTFSDPARGGYARLELASGRVRRAVLVGLPAAAAGVGQLYERGLPLPSDRLALLRGTPPRGGEVPRPDGESVVCHCNNVTRSTVSRAWRSGVRDVPGLSDSTRAGTGCGSCVAELRSLCAALAASDGTRPAVAQAAGGRGAR